MATLLIQKATLDAMGEWEEIKTQCAFPVWLGIPATTVIEGIEYYLFDDPRLTQDQALFVAQEVVI